MKRRAEWERTTPEEMWFFVLFLFYLIFPVFCSCRGFGISVLFVSGEKVFVFKMCFFFVRLTFGCWPEPPYARSSVWTFIHLFVCEYQIKILASKFQFSTLNANKNTEMMWCWPAANISIGCVMRNEKWLQQNTYTNSFTK